MKDLTGERFGRLLACERVAAPYTHTKYRCRCDCGAEAVVLQTHLLRGATTSCGCRNAEVIAARNAASAKHGMWKSREFALWTGMLARCYNARHENYPHYGGRGITVCEEWRTSFPAFYSHMGPRPSSHHSLERIDNDRGYEPGNVKWATIVEQANNRRNNLYIEYQGRRLTATQFAREHGLNPDCVRQRIKRGVTGSALAAPPHPGVS